MIISIEVNNFRQHKSRSFNFTQGLNALRGANESGKSTVLEAALYALYGAKALRDNLAETVTWGEKESSLKVTLTIKTGNVIHVFTRSKSGAECRGDDGVVVTGQTEVAAFAAELLGADAKVAGLLMMASQSGLRGALDDGPVAVSGLMAKLADFDVVDRVIEAAASKLQLGSVVVLQQKIDDLEAKAVQARAALPDPLVHEEKVKVLEQVKAQVAKLVELEDKVLDPARQAAEDAVDAAEKINSSVRLLVSRHGDLTNRVIVETSKKEAALDEILKAPGSAVIEALRAEANVELNHSVELTHYKGFLALKYPAEFWEGSEQSFLEELEQSRTAVSSQMTAIAAAKSQVKTLKGQRITNGQCPTCGHASRSDEHVAEHNKKIDDQIEVIEKSLVGWVKNEKGLQANLYDMIGVQNAAKLFYTSISPLGSRVKLDSNFHPAKVSWAGAIPGDTPSSVAATKLKDAQALQRAADMAQGRYDAAVVSLTELDNQLAETLKQIVSRPEVDLAPLKKAYDEAFQVFAANSLQVSEDKERCRTLQAEVDQGLQAAKVQLAVIDECVRRVEELKTDIKTTEFNNTLVSKLKKVKPAITDHLWNITLGAVGSFFSTMRGETSVVTKDKDGFKVNGRSAESLSGSALDVLALAVRVALTKTFIPHAAFLTLDEPAAACDNGRTGNVLGFLSSVGFHQTILASHDELSEAVADNVINLGD